MSRSKVFLIPTTLGQIETPTSLIPSSVIDSILSLNYFVVENIRESRRYLASIGLRDKIDTSQFIEINKREKDKGIIEATKWIKAEIDIGILSDAGCPGIADPGSMVVSLAHKHGCRIIPLVGPSSILLALIGSGLNGQSFAFHGYLPKVQAERVKKLKELEKESFHKKQTQIFMETPYRNNNLIEDLLIHLNTNTKLCIACSLTLPQEYIISKTIAEWKKTQIPNINKMPSIFLLQQ